MKTMKNNLISRYMNVTFATNYDYVSELFQ